MQTLAQFVAAHNGRYLDFDHVYGAQCVDLVLYYCRDVWGLPPLPGNAIDEFGEESTRILWTRNDPKNLAQIPPAGAVIIWGPSWKVGTGVYGHTAVVVESDRAGFTSFDQNWPVGAPCHEVRHTYDGIIGWGVKRAPLPLPLPIKPAPIPLPTIPPAIPPPIPPPNLPPVVVADPPSIPSGPAPWARPGCLQLVLLAALLAVALLVIAFH